MHLPLLSLLFVSALLAFDVPLSGPVSNFIDDFYANDSDMNVRIIRHPSAPFVHEGMLYYWKGYYKGTPSYPKKCTFLADKIEWPFGNVTFTNGTSPSGVEFGCGRETLCKQYHCEHTISPGLFWVTLLVISAIISVAVYARYWVVRRRQPRVDQDIEMNSIYVPVVVADRGGPPYRPLRA
ncbi:unnamed protein product [Caenorhabditis sp. 36 PRJEB53466]|nr:unnamed protein product [Caenorhabditis sp. 36 PRJEB53466]